MIHTLTEIMYITIGIILVINAVLTLTKGHDILSSLFWFILGAIFILGKHLPSSVTGLCLIILGALTLFKRVRSHAFSQVDEQERQNASLKIGSQIFIPALLIAVVAFLVAQFTGLGGLLGLGFGALVAFIVGVLMTHSQPKYIIEDSSTLLQQMGPVLLLPQLLGSLGAIFAKANIGGLISETMAGLVPAGSQFWGVVLYCVGMAIFTMIMGNAFAAFALITTGIGFPFVLSLGANPVVVGSLGLTAGYCGTLMTPMAANFNVLPASILQMDKSSRIILTQLPVALMLLGLHIVLMYTWGFSR